VSAHDKPGKNGLSLQQIATTLLGVGLGATMQGSAPLTSESFSDQRPAGDPPTTRLTEKKEQYGPFVDFNRLPLKENWAVKRKIKQHQVNTKTTDPAILAVSETTDGTKNRKIYQGDVHQTRDMASVGKMLSIVMLNDLIEKDVIALDTPLDKNDLKEYGLRTGTTYRDAIAAAYTESNNFVIHAAVKSAVRADMKITTPTLPNEHVAEYMSRYMIAEGMNNSIQFNGAGYPVNADEFSGPFSFKGAPSRINQFDIKEAADFFERKICTTGLNPEIESMLNLKNGAPQMQHPIDGDEIRPLNLNGFAKQTVTKLGSLNDLVMAKTGTSNEATAGFTANRDKYGNCQVTIGIGAVPDRNTTIPEIAKTNQQKSFAATPSSLRRKL